MSEMVLISIHPRFVEAILNGEKTIEFRRRWTNRPVGHLVIYATSPVKKIVALVPVEEVVEASPTSLWRLAQQQGGGITRSELYDYFRERPSGIGLRLGKVRRLQEAIDPYRCFEGFRPPQSFRFLVPEEVLALQRARLFSPNRSRKVTTIQKEHPLD